MTKADIRAMKVKELNELAIKWNVEIPEGAKRQDVLKLLLEEQDRRENAHDPNQPEFGNLEMGEAGGHGEGDQVGEDIDTILASAEGASDSSSTDEASPDVLKLGDKVVTYDIESGVATREDGSVVEPDTDADKSSQDGSESEVVTVEEAAKLTQEEQAFEDSAKPTGDKTDKPNEVDEVAAFEKALAEERAARATAHIVDLSSVPVTMIPMGQVTPSKMNFFKPLSLAKMNELRESIINNGLLNPIIVRPNKDGKDETRAYEILAGENRYNIFHDLEKFEIPARIVDVTDDKAKEILVDTNVAQRGELTPMEIAKAYHEKKLIIGNRQGQRSDLKGDDAAGATRDIIAQEYGKSGMTVDRYLRLVNLLPEFQEKIEEGTIPVKTGMELGLLDTKTQQQILKYNKYGDENVSTRNVSSIKKALNEKKKVELAKPENKGKKDITVALTKDEMDKLLNADQDSDKGDTPKPLKFTVEVPVDFDGETKEFIEGNLVNDNIFLLNLLKDYVHGKLVHAKKEGA
ncbi:ParB/RepB/Spo0J family partition protein [Paenibacillus sp. MMO-177]|uniref:ParB/RepB/Spo0J family partition protein n=1 Tax=Paenibacillus sp. MMO-177 TaxID=3081289 RepID=UPI0030173A36